MSFELAPMASHNVIGFVGLDQLSLQLASSLLRFGYAVQAFETCSPLLDEFANQGGIRCASPVEVGKDVVALVVLISPADQINDLLFGHESALKGLRKDAVIILHSTILPAHIQKLEKRLTEDLERVFVVDIYVSKGMSEVLNGKIMIISSGQSDAITRARPILSAMSEKLYVFEGALGARRVFKNHVPQLLRDNQTKHLLNTFVQNLGVVLDMAKSCTFPLPLLAVAFQQLIAGSSHGHGNDGDDTLIKVKGMITDFGDDMHCQFLEILRNLLDSYTSGSQRDTIIEIFYEKHLGQLIDVITSSCPPNSIDQSVSKSVGFGSAENEIRAKPEILLNICELLCFCVLHHLDRIKCDFLLHNVIDKVLFLTHRKEKYLVLAAVRFFRTLISRSDEHLMNHIVKNNLLKPIVEAFICNGNHYNLLNSAVLELFEYIRKENLKVLLKYVVDSFWNQLVNFENLTAIHGLKVKYEQSLDNPGMKNSVNLLDTRKQIDERALDKEEEDYFNEDSLLICYSSGAVVMLLLLLRCCGDAAVMVFVTMSCCCVVVGCLLVVLMFGRVQDFLSNL